MRVCPGGRLAGRHVGHAALVSFKQPLCKQTCPLTVREACSKHKTAKKSFQEVSVLGFWPCCHSAPEAWPLQKYYASVAANTAGTSALLASPALRGRALAALGTRRVV